MVMVQQIHDSQMAISESHQVLNDKLSKHMTEETHELAQAITNLMAAAFPEGDPGGHRRHHELVIQKEEERVEFWKKMRYELAKWGLIGFAGWAIGYLWMGFLQGPHR
jgi:hypothetical protein